MFTFALAPSLKLVALILPSLVLNGKYTNQMPGKVFKTNKTNQKMLLMEQREEGEFGIFLFTEQTRFPNKASTVSPV